MKRIINDNISINESSKTYQKINNLKGKSSDTNIINNKKTNNAYTYFHKLNKEISEPKIIIHNPTYQKINYINFRNLNNIRESSGNDKKVISDIKKPKKVFLKI